MIQEYNFFDQPSQQKNTDYSTMTSLGVDLITRSKSVTEDEIYDLKKSESQPLLQKAKSTYTNTYVEKIPISQKLIQSDEAQKRESKTIINPFLG